MGRHLLGGSALGIALLATSLALPAKQPGTITAADSRKPAPDFTLTSSKGASVALAHYKGRVVLLDFWATWCAVCKTAIPRYVGLQNKYKHDGISLIGVSLDDDGWKSVRPFMKQIKVNYPVVIGNEDLAQRVGINVNGLPVVVLIDRDGRIADLHAGLGNKDAFEVEVRTLLQENANASVR